MSVCELYSCLIQQIPRLRGQGGSFKPKEPPRSATAVKDADNYRDRQHVSREHTVHTTQQTDSGKD